MSIPLNYSPRRFYMPLINRWREARERAGLSMREACQDLGIGKSMLSQIETGTAHTTSRIMERACRIYGCQMSDLLEVFEEEGEMMRVP
jgi:transcriptional regulator with XRE-family HTH domain